MKKPTFQTQYTPEWKDLAIANQLTANQLIDLAANREPTLALDARAHFLQIAIKKNPAVVSYIQKKYAHLCTRKLPKRITTSQHALTDGVDHLFPIPKTTQGKINLLKRAINKKLTENLALLFSRAVWNEPHTLKRPHRSFPAIYSDAAISKIDADLGHNPFLQGCDFLVSWNEVLTDGYTLAELLRMILLTDFSSSPDVEIRYWVIAFYRTVMKTGHGSTVGLSSGVFHVEHGDYCPDSLFYLGRHAILGKGLKVDGVGGFVSLSRSFIGGGFSPILIHTHKHLTPKNGKAVDERKSILPCIFFAEANSRFPMSHVGIFETADYLSKKSPYPGISSIQIKE